ncbi:MAG: hypothetical protein QOJ19_1414 [Acidimicrobiia bacterium]|nr:hypothetical protein [Acidimicrobiia bacterium]
MSELCVSPYPRQLQCREYGRAPTTSLRKEVVTMREAPIRAATTARIGAERIRPAVSRWRR